MSYQQSQHFIFSSLCLLCLFVAQSVFVEEDRDVAADVGLVKGVFFSNGFPGWRTGGGFSEEEFFICEFDTHVADIRARKTTAANKSIARRPGPAGLDVERANTVDEREEMANHRRRSDRETMALFRRDLNTRAGAVRIPRERRKSSDQPIDSGFAKQIVGIPQCEVFRHIPAARETRSLFRFR